MAQRTPDIAGRYNYTRPRGRFHPPVRNIAPMRTPSDEEFAKMFGEDPGLSPDDKQKLDQLFKAVPGIRQDLMPQRQKQSLTPPPNPRQRPVGPGQMYEEASMASPRPRIARERMRDPSMAQSPNGQPIGPPENRYFPPYQMWGSTRGSTETTTEPDFKAYQEHRYGGLERISDKLPPYRSSIAASGLDMTPQEYNLYVHHIEHLSPGERFRERNQLGQLEGTTSTVQQMTVEHGGRVYNVPTIWHGRKIRGPELGKYIQPLDQWPSYGSEDEAEKRYNEMHGAMEMDIFPNFDEQEY